MCFFEYLRLDHSLKGETRRLVFQPTSFMFTDAEREGPDRSQIFGHERGMNLPHRKWTSYALIQATSMN